MKKPISKSELARLVNVSPAAITKACNGKLKDAFDGKRIDANHPLVIEYIKRKELQQSRKINTTPKTQKLKKVKKEIEHTEYEFVEVKKPHIRGHNAKKETKKTAVQHHTSKGIEVPEHVKKYLKYTIEDVINEFGTDTALSDFLLAVKRIKDIEKVEIANSKASGELVHRDLIKIGIIDPINTAHTRLLTDGAKTIAKDIIEEHDSGANIYEIEKIVSEKIGSYFKQMKKKIKETLKNVDNN